MSPLVLAVLVVAHAAPTDADVRKALGERFERAGRTTPPEDPALARAAKEIAKRALGSGADEAASLLRVTAAISRNGGWDPNPTTVVIRASLDELLATLARQDLAGEPVTQLGAGLAIADDRAAVAVLLARRRFELEPFARTHKKPPKAPQRLCGTLVTPLDAADAFVTRPGGDVERVAMESAPKARGRLCADLTFPVTGRHTVEVLARGPRGPEVAALFFVDVGAVGAQESDEVSEPSTPAEARAALLVRINALRLKMGLAALSLDPELDAVAGAWADRLAAEGFFSHVAPDGSDLKQRLTARKYRFASAGENLGLSSGPLAAHFGIEHSPGHRKNLLEANHRRLGIGLSKRADGLTVLVEVLASLQDESADKDPLAAAYDAIAAERKRKGLPKLSPHPVLESLAQEHARAMFAAQTPKVQLPGAKRLHERVFETLDAPTSVAVDIFLSDAPRLIVDSKNLAAANNTMVGVGLVRGDSAQHGDGRYWIVVIYAGSSRH